MRQEILSLITKMVIELEMRPVIINLVKAGDRTRNGPLDYQTGNGVRNKTCGYQSGKSLRPDQEWSSRLPNW